MIIKLLSYSTETYILYYVQRVNSGINIYVSCTSQIGPIPTKVGIVFAMNQKMILKGASWAGTCPWRIRRVNDGEDLHQLVSVVCCNHTTKDAIKNSIYNNSSNCDRLFFIQHFMD